MRKISVNQLTTMCWSFDEDVVFYRSRGIKRIGIGRGKALDFGIEKCREILRDAGMSVSSYGSISVTNDIAGPSLNEQLVAGHQEIENAASLAADCLVLHTGGQAGHLHKNRFCVAQRMIDQLLPMAEEYGVTLAIEPQVTDEVTGRQHSHSLTDSKELIDHYDSRYLGLALDLFHVGNDFLSLTPEWFGANVCLVQFSDFVSRKNRRLRAPIGSGSLELDAFCHLVERSDYDGVFEFELYGESFDLISYQETISGVADTLTVTPNVAPVAFESVKA